MDLTALVLLRALRGHAVEPDPSAKDRRLSKLAESLRELRAFVADFHHGLREDRAVGKSRALREVISEAKLAGVSEEGLEEMRDGFPKIAQELLQERGKRFRRPSLAETRRQQKLGPAPLVLLAEGVEEETDGAKEA